MNNADSLGGFRVVLVGGAGFIGHNLALHLKRRGAEVTVIDGLNVNNYWALKKDQDLSEQTRLYLGIIAERLELLRAAGIPVREVDARDYDALSRHVGDCDPQAIVHLAAVAHANRSNKDPFSTFDHSLRTLENALDVARSPNLNVNHFVYFSSSMVYGHFPSGYVTEKTACAPLGIYGTLKYAGEKIVEAYGHVFDLPFTIIRPSALYGPRCISGRVGQVFIENALRGQAVSIHGDGSDALDFTYIDDLVAGVIRVLQCTEAKGQVFNLTFGESRTIAMMADILMKHFPDVEVNYLPKDRFTPDRGTLSVDKARSMLGYEPQFPLDVGFVKYIEWYKQIAAVHPDLLIGANV